MEGIGRAWVGVFFLATAAEALQDQQVGARTKAMGGSYTAFEDDPVSIWLNPGGIATQPDGLAFAYQTYTIYDFEVDEAAGTIDDGPAEYAWSDPAIIPSFLGVTFQLGTPEEPQALGFCFTTPFRLKFAYDTDLSGGVLATNATCDQVFYRIRAAYARDFRFRAPGEEGFMTHLAVGLGLDVNVTNWTLTEFKPIPGDGDATLTASGTDMGFGGGAGLLLGLYDNTRNFKVNLGAAYQSQANYRFSLDIDPVPLFDWPTQYQVGLTFYLFDDFPLRLTFDAQLIAWSDAVAESALPGVDDFENAVNYSAGVEYRIKLSDRVRLYPRAGVRFYDAPWDDDENLPAISTSRLTIDTRDEAFVIFSGGFGLGWSSQEGKLRSFDLAFDVGGDAPGMAVSFSLEF